MKLFRFWWFLLLISSLPARSQEAPQVDWTKQSVFLFGNKSSVDNAVLMAFPGRIKDDEFDFSMFTPARANQPSIDGYFVGVAKGDEVIAMSSIGSHKGQRFVYWLCGGMSTPVLFASPGKIIYIADVDLDALPVDPSSRKLALNMQLSWDAASAKDWVKTHYPEELDRFVVAPQMFLPVQGSCTAQQRRGH